LNHESTLKCFPSGGWGFEWVGDPNYGFAKWQPGGFFYNILPFMEQQGLHDIALGIGTSATDSTRIAINDKLVQAPIGAYSCPSRRAPGVCGMCTTSDPSMNFTATPTNGKGFFHADYAGNAGDYFLDWKYGPKSWPSNLTASGFTDTSNCSGVIFQQSQLTIAEIKDGTSNTYLAGEKYLCPDNYLTGMSGGDNNPALGADSFDLNRWASQTGGGTATSSSSGTFYPPCQDTSGSDQNNCFGSAHAAGFNVVFCDGSVRNISYLIDVIIHAQLANRKDGKAIDGSKL
jgi:prepilin-type processing-associated H-X9-DG protein